MLKRHRLGELGEALAAAHLESNGYSVVDRRFACVRGDIDLVCRRADEVVLVEVKTRATAAFGEGAETISESKRMNLKACAREYRAMTGWRGQVKFMLASVRLTYGAQEGTVELDLGALD